MDPTSSQSAAELRALRLRITALILLLATAIVTVFAVVTVRLDTQFREEKITADLLAKANLVAQQIDIEETEMALEALYEAGVQDEVVVGVRAEIDRGGIEASGITDTVPPPSAEDLEPLIVEAIGYIPEEDMVEMLGLSEPLSLAEMQTRVREEFDGELSEEAWIDYHLIAAEEAEVEVLMPMQLIRSESSVFDEATAMAALERASQNRTDHEVEGSGADTFGLDGGRFAVRGAPILSGWTDLGAIVAVVDRQPVDAAHAGFRNRIALVGLLLVVGAGAGAWLVAGRTIRPAARALAQQERFLADAAHELRTPIAAIRATAEAGAGADPRAALDRVVELSRDASQLTGDLLMLARMDADRLSVRTELVRLDLLVEALVDGDAAFRFRADPLVVHADPGLLATAIDNLLRNARIHGGACADQPADVVVADGEVRVHDRGPGIDAATKGRLFDRFGSGAGSPGHGLGLALTRWIARAHGGDCFFDPDVTPGTAFVLRLSA